MREYAGWGRGEPRRVGLIGELPIITREHKEYEIGALSKYPEAPEGLLYPRVVLVDLRIITDGLR